MRLMISNGETGPRLLALVENDVLDLSVAAPDLPPDIGELAAGGEATLERLERAIGAASGQTVPHDRIVPALPVARPGKFICLGLNYIDHAKEGGYDIPEYPALFMRATSSLIPAGAPILRPSVSERLDYEAELTVVIGRRAKHVPESEALDYVFGYTIFNDVSVRDYQRKTHQWTPGKNFDATGPIGPVVVTPDELPPGASGLRISTDLNGETMQDANTSDMMFTTARTIAILSEFMTLEPGDLIALGTPQGVGHARTPPVWMKPGDVVTIEIEGIGQLRNPIEAEKPL